MDEDPFETVAITWSQPQAGVILALFAWNAIPAYGMNLETIRVNCPLTLALGGIPIRVHREYAAEARGLLEEAVVREAEPMPPEPLAERICKVALLGVLGMTPPPKVSAGIIG